jgi:hypothetical protein
VGPIAKGMFEKPVSNFAEASAFSEIDRLRGNAASVMFGTLAPAGTGSVNIKDLEKLPSARIQKKEEAKRRDPVDIPLKLKNRHGSKNHIK